MQNDAKDSKCANPSTHKTDSNDPASAPLLTRRELRMAREQAARTQAKVGSKVAQATVSQATVSQAAASQPAAAHASLATTRVTAPESLDLPVLGTGDAPTLRTQVETPIMTRPSSTDAPEISEVVSRPVSAAATGARVRSKLTPGHARAVLAGKIKGATPKRRQSAFDYTQSIKIHPEPLMTTPAHPKQTVTARLGLRKRLSVLLVAAGIILTGAVPSYAVDPVVTASAKAGEPISAEALRVQQQQLATAAGEGQEFTAFGAEFATDDDSIEDLDRDSANAQLPLNLNAARSRSACHVPDPTGAGVDAEVVVPVPVGSFDLTSGVGPRWGRWHNGQDFAADKGTSIVAAHSGTVVGVGFWGVNPYIAIRGDKLEDGKVYGTVYEHMPTSSIVVAEGDRVVAGQEIAAVGNEGQSTGAHLHFEVHDITGKADEKFLGVKTHIQPVQWLRQYSAVGLAGC